MKILLGLLSEQHVPNLLSVHHFQPDRLMLVESETMRQKGAAEKLLRALQLGGLDYYQRVDMEPLDDENRIEAVRRCLQRGYAKYPEAEWIANLTGGTKPMSIAAYEFFKAIEARLVYTAVDRPGEFLDPRQGTVEVCNYRPGVREFVAGYGFECPQPSDALKRKKKTARKWWPTARILAELSAAKPVATQRLHERLKHRRSGKLELEEGELVSPNAAVRQALGNTFGLRISGESLLGEIDRWASDFLTGGWLETFIWGLLERHQGPLGLNDLQLGIVFNRPKDSTSNEIDVAFLFKHALGIVECKSGAQQVDRKFDVLYKVEAVRRQFGALRVSSWLVTTSDLVYETQGKEKTLVTDQNGRPRVKQHLKDRARFYNCRIVPRHFVEELARRPDDLELLREAFFAKG